MSSKTLIGGTSYTIRGGKTLINGTSYSIARGKVMKSGTVYTIDMPQTNLVSTSVATDGKTVFNGTGYMNGTYASAPHYGTDAACVTTGWIWLPADTKTIFIKGATWNTSNSHCRVLVISDANLGTSSLAQSIKATETSGNGWIGNWGTFTTLGTNYYKWDLNDNGTTYLGNRWYCVSLVGTGTNLVITHDQPID